MWLGLPRPLSSSCLLLGNDLHFVKKPNASNGCHPARGRRKEPGPSCRKENRNWPPKHYGIRNLVVWQARPPLPSLSRSSSPSRSKGVCVGWCCPLFSLSLRRNLRQQRQQPQRHRYTYLRECFNNLLHKRERERRDTPWCYVPHSSPPRGGSQWRRLPLR